MKTYSICGLQDGHKVGYYLVKEETPEDAALVFVDNHLIAYDGLWEVCIRDVRSFWYRIGRASHRVVTRVLPPKKNLCPYCAHGGFDLLVRRDRQSAAEEIRRLALELEEGDAHHEGMFLGDENGRCSVEDVIGWLQARSQAIFDKYGHTNTEPDPREVPIVDPEVTP